MNTATQIAEPIFLKVGAFLFQIESLKQASEIYCASRDAYGEGASGTPECKVVTADHREVAHISYNGRVWPAGGYQSDIAPLYDNRAV